MAHREHTAIRTCVVCGRKRCKAELLRLVLDSSAQVTPDLRQRLPGRGGYVCTECVPNLRRTKRVQKAFRQQVKGISEEVFRQLSTR